MFETETMAELCVKQGLTHEAIAIYRRLLAASPDEATRARRSRRIAELTPRGAAATARAPFPQPGIELHHDGREMTLEWRLPDDIHAPALQILVLRRDEFGIATERRTVAVERPAGQLTLPMAGVHSIRAAAGRMDGDRFVPLARLGRAQESV
jgi:hypothetical protein